MATSGSKLYEVWEDTISIRDLVWSLALTIGLTMAGYLIAPPEPPFPLVAGLAGAVLGFIISTIISRPKRKLETEMIDETEDAPQDRNEGGH